MTADLSGQTPADSAKVGAAPRKFRVHLTLDVTHEMDADELWFGLDQPSEPCAADVIALLQLGGKAGLLHDWNMTYEGDIAVIVQSLDNRGDRAEWKADCDAAREARHDTF